MTAEDASQPTGSGPSGGVQSVDRALTVLELLAKRGASGVTEIAQELGVHKSTAFRLISVLEAHQLVEQVGDRGKYHLGFGLVRLAGATTAQLDLTRESQPICEQLAAEVGETVNIAVLEDVWVINISQARGPASVASHNWIGQLTPPHATSSGKVLLAHLPEDRLAPLLARGLTAHTPQTITTPDELRHQLAEARRSGYATTTEELEVGLNAIAAPIFDASGQVAAALSASGPSYRITAERLPELAGQVRAAAAAISRRLGFRGHAVA